MTTTRATDVTNLTIDGQPVQARRGTTILEAAEQAGIYIPHLCFLHGLPPFVGCRTCIVEIEGTRDLELACSEPVREGMVVSTNSKKVLEMRRTVMEVLISDHPWKCLTCWRRERCDPMDTCQREASVDDRCVWCAKNRDCELQMVCDFVDMTWDEPAFYQPPRTLPLQWSNPFVEFDPNKCIYCTRCIRACSEIRAIGALELSYRGDNAIIAAAFNDDLQCEFCGDCAAVCPCAAIMDRPRKFMGTPDKSTYSVCSYCSVGCGVKLDMKDPGKESSIFMFRPDQRQTGLNVYAIGGNPDSPVSHGELCVRGRYGNEFIHHKTRILQPLQRRPQVDEEREHPLEWEAALDLVANRLADVRSRHGADAIGVLGSTRATNEESYLIQKLARAAIGTNNVDTAASPFHRPTVDGLLASLGVAGATCSLADLESAANAIFVVGNNTTDTHPVAGLMIKDAVRKRGAQLIVAHPLETTNLNSHPTLSDLNRFAALWLRYRPGTEGVLLGAIAREVIDNDLMGAAEPARAVLGFGEWYAGVREVDLERAAEITGVPAASMQKAARLLVGAALTPGPSPACGRGETGRGAGGEGREGPRQPRPAVLVFGSGLSYEEASPQLVAGAVNLALATGNVGRAGGGVLPLVADNNTQGAADMGVLPDLLPGYQPVGDAAARGRLAQAWFAGANAALPERPGLDFAGMIDAARRGELKALVVVGDDPLRSAPAHGAVREALDRVELLVVVDLLMTETAKLAHVVLPGASFAEKEGTFTNAERRVQRLNQAIDPLGKARPDWWVIAELGNRLAARAGAAVRFGYSSAADVLHEIGQVVHAYAGITIDRLAARGMQWPCPNASHPGTPTLFADGAGICRFLPVPAPVLSARDGEPALLLARTIYTDPRGLGAASKRLSKVLPQDFALLGEADARRLGVEDGDPISLATADGRLETVVRVSQSVPAGIVHLAIDQQGHALDLVGLRRNGAPTTVQVRPAAVGARPPGR
ncbi:MAG: molybdopterin-dependent oxidoreductase [Chloroflexi bacterium]|nr:molybdopterin-dependent oxidoreductase [Chloroflexota bacterium]